MSESTPSQATKEAWEPHPKLGLFYDQITGDEDARVCKDIPDAACRHLPRNFFAYLVSNFLSKVADELASARLVLPWLLGAVGAPAVFVGFLVPIREAGVLLPQLAVAAYIRRLPKRKGVWMLGALLSALALVCMAFTTATLDGVAAGWAVLALVTLFSLARGICSVSAKDVLGKTVSKTRRGAMMGYSAAAAGVVTLLIGAFVELSSERTLGAEFFMVFLLAAAGIWLLAIAVFAYIHEEPGATEGGGNAIVAALQSLSLLKTDRAFRHYVVARSLLLSAALAPPFYVLLAQERSASVTDLGLLIIASGLAASLSAPVWGRKVYLVDMASHDTRSAYVAVSNTVIGAAMLAGGAVGVLADLFSTSAVIALLGVVSLLAAIYIARLPDVSG